MSEIGKSGRSERCVAPSWKHAVGAACEVVGVLLTGILLQGLVQSALGLESWKALQAEMVRNSQPDFLLLARASLVELLIRYGFILGLGLGIGWWLRRRSPRAYGVSLGGRSWPALIRVGIVLWAVIGAVPYAVQLLARRFPVLGVGPDHWSLFPSSWSWSFVLYMAVSSFALVPVVEELWARGYMVTRLKDGSGAGGAMLVSTLFFAFAHTQYFKLEVLSMGMLLSLVLGSLASAGVLLRTGSLLPCIVAHAMVNLPLPSTGPAQAAALGVMLLVLAASRRSIVEWAGWVASELQTQTPRLPTLISIATLALVLGAMMISRTAVITLGVSMLALAVVLAARERNELSRG